MSILLSLVLAGVGFVALLLGLAILYRRPVVGTGLLFLLLVLDTFSPIEGPILFLGGRNVYPPDVVAVGFLLVGVFGLLGRNRIRSKGFVILTGFLVLLLFGFIEGVLAFGLRDATNAARTYLYFVSAVVFFAQVKDPVTNWRRIENLWFLFGLFLVIVVLIRWSLGSIGIVWNRDWESPGGGYLRVVSAASAFLLLQFVLIALHRDSLSKSIKFLSYVAIPILLFLQHRTVWVVGLLTFLLALTMERKSKGKLVQTGLIAAIVGGILFTFFFGNELASSLQRSAESTSTLEWRIEGWQALVDPTRFHGVAGILLGNPIGMGYARYLPGIDAPVSVAPHNYYIQLFSDLGLTGLLLFLSLYVLLFSSYRIRQPWKSWYPTVLPYLLFAQLVFNVTYGPSVYQGAILGMAISFYAVRSVDKQVLQAGAVYGNISGSYRKS